MKTMKNKQSAQFRFLLILVITLTGAIFCGLLYLVVSGGSKKIALAGTATQTPAAVITSQPVATATAAATSTPASTATPAPTSTTVTADTSTDTSLQRIVNQTHTISANYVPSDLVQPNVSMNNVQTMRKEAASALEKMFAAAAKDGIQLYLVSGYRSYELQTSLYHTYIQEYGENYANHIDSIPGASEHQLGLSADFGSLSRACELDNCFSAADSYTWLIKHAPEYGYILRYPEGKESVTGIDYEPWAFRYIGADAEKITASGLTLEEYYNLK